MPDWSISMTNIVEHIGITFCMNNNVASTKTN